MFLLKVLFLSPTQWGEPRKKTSSQPALPRQQPPEEEEEEEEGPEGVHEDFRSIVQFLGYVPVARNLILFHPKAPSNQVMEVLVHPSYLGLFPQSITLV